MFGNTFAFVNFTNCELANDYTTVENLIAIDNAIDAFYIFEFT